MSETCTQSDNQGDVLCRHYDVILDKGTYDAISLNPENALEQRKQYITNVHAMLKDGGLLFITSCNWTEDQLKEQFKSVKVLSFIFNNY